MCVGAADPCFFNMGHMGSHCNGSSDHFIARQQHDNGCPLALSYLSCIIMTLPHALSSFVMFITIWHHWHGPEHFSDIC